MSEKEKQKNKKRNNEIRKEKRYFKTKTLIDVQRIKEDANLVKYIKKQRKNVEKEIKKRNKTFKEIQIRRQYNLVGLLIHSRYSL